MSFDLPEIPGDFGQGGANIGDGAPKLSAVLAAHRQAIVDAGDQIDAAVAATAVAGDLLTLTAGTPGDLTFDADDTGRHFGCLFAANGEVLGMFVAVNASHYNGGAFVSPSPMEVLGQEGNKVWVRLDKLSRPLKTQSPLFVGVNGAPLSPSGMSDSDGFSSFPYMADMFGNSLDAISPTMDLVLGTRAPSPIIPSGDFGGGIAAEASASCAAGDVLAIDATGKVAPCLADSDAHAALALGVATHQVTLPDLTNPRKAVIVAIGGGSGAWRQFNPETSIAFAPGDKIFVSASEAGHVTNVAPAHARQVGICTSNDESGVLGLVRL